MLYINRIIFILFAAVLIYSCSDSDREPKGKIPDLNDTEYVMQLAQKGIGEPVSFAYAGNFTIDTNSQIIAGVEVSTADEWGIKFYNLVKEENVYVKSYKTDLLDGSYNECLVKKIKFPHLEYELIYYNSQNYFLGSGSGEIISYIADFQKKEIYYSHLFFERERAVSLFLSENIDADEIKNFFLSVFKKDYPDLKIVAKDVKLDI